MFEDWQGFKRIGAHVIPVNIGEWLACSRNFLDMLMLARILKRVANRDHGVCGIQSWTGRRRVTILMLAGFFGCERLRFIKL
jgi:hypothetical protein